MVSHPERLGLASFNILFGFAIAAWVHLEVGAFIIAIGIWMGLWTLFQILKTAF